MVQKFKIGEIVTLKENTISPIVDISIPIELTTLFKVISFSPDLLWEDREGEVGGGHLYTVENIFNNRQIDIHQYRLEYAVVRIDDLINKNLDYLNKLLNIKKRL